MNKYDISIIGGGPAAIFAAYELINKKPIIRTTSLDFWNDNIFRVFSKVKVQLFKLDEQEINKFLKKKR